MTISLRAGDLSSTRRWVACSRPSTATTSIRTCRRSRITCFWRRRSARRAKPSSTSSAPGDRASAVLGYEEAAIHFRHALELLASTGDGSGKRRGELLLRLGDAQWRSGDGSRAALTFERAIDAARRSADAGDACASGARLRDRARRIPALRAIPGRRRRHGRSWRRRSLPSRRATTRCALDCSPTSRSRCGRGSSPSSGGWHERRSDRDGTPPR